MFCPECDKTVEEGIVFCPECGFRIENTKGVISIPPSFNKRGIVFYLSKPDVRNIFSKG